jgi:hypothetical protein
MCRTEPRSPLNHDGSNLLLAGWVASHNLLPRFLGVGGAVAQRVGHRALFLRDIEDGLRGRRVGAGSLDVRRYLCGGTLPAPTRAL